MLSNYSPILSLHFPPSHVLSQQIGNEKISRDAHDKKLQIYDADM